MAPPRPASTLALLEEVLPAHAGRLRALAARAEAGGDGSLVHDVRVALRRLEALARLFRGVPGEGDGEEVRLEARDLRRRLSLLRSEEVGRALLAARAGDGSERLAAALFPRTSPEAAVAAADLARVERRVAAWERRLSEAFRGAFSPRPGADDELRRRASRRLRHRLSELIALLPPRRRRLHATRIAAKTARYALEAVEPVEERARPLLRLLRSFQQAAGDAHDLLELATRISEAGPALAGASVVAPLLRGLDADAAAAYASARRSGAAVERAARRLRAALRGARTR